MTATRPYSILITDDDRDSREALRDIVAPQGYRTILAASGEEALEVILGEPVHLVLVDYRMPRLTGLETIRLMHQENAVLPCILVTADAEPALIRQALLAHVYSVIPKPVSKNVVLYTVVRALGRTYGPPADPDQPTPAGP
ncbi:MAG TPA: response regulator [Gemmataceae bacterium]|jgi:CheY-like chemotaxis protein